ncbi:MAG TPA: YggT family protein [Acidimicrobiales bacterium]|nr:YggT family protein [Acidimicrobiales bacterium]
MRTLVIDLLYAYAFVLFIRVALSWATAYSRSQPLQQVERALAKITDPVLSPIRRALPASGRIDWSPTIAMVGCYILARLLGG